MTSFNGDRNFFDCPPDCPERKPACQGSCERYKKKRAEYDRLKAAERRRECVSYYVRDTASKRANDRAITNKNHRKQKKFNH